MPANQPTAYPQGGVWDDVLGPTFALGTGGAAPALVAFPTGTTGRLYRSDASDLFYFSLQFPHTAQPGSIIIKPHVHWTMVVNPTASQNLIWSIDWNYAAPTGTFAATMTTLPAATYATTGAEANKHLITEFPDITITMAPSGIFYGVLSSPTVPASQNPVLLSFDIHFQKGPFGTFSPTV